MEEKKKDNREEDGVIFSDVKRGKARCYEVKDDWGTMQRGMIFSSVDIERFQELVGEGSWWSHI